MEVELPPPRSRGFTLSDLQQFRTEFAPEQIDDLRERLRRTRWPEQETVDDWSQGVPLAYLQDLCRYWADSYDFDAAAARLNAHPQFRVGIDGLDIHFLHVRSPHEGALPLVLTHGWPGSLVEFLGVIEPLTNPADPADAFHVVVPSLPGYGCSDRPSAVGWGVHRIAAAWDELLRVLGYPRYGAQGGDWGMAITDALGQRYPERVTGIHVTGAVLPTDLAPYGALTPEELDDVAALQEHARSGRGYSVLQSTRPQTLGYGLTDSPAGQCAWIVEKLRAWTDCAGHPENALTRDQMLDNVSLYWFTATGTSSARLYWEGLGTLGRVSWTNAGGLDQDRVDVPAGVSIFPHEMFRASRRMVEARYTDLRWYNRLPAGGHFGAWEQPDIFVDEVRSFFRLVRDH
jgi:pimeloyl-ACP methyl ester carboxylesterase